MFSKSKHSRIIATILSALLACSSFFMTGCDFLTGSDNVTVSEKIQRLTVREIEIECDPVGETVTSSSYVNGNIIEIPDGLGTYSSYELDYLYDWYPGSNQEAIQTLWQEKGGVYSPEGFATIDGRAIVATTPKFGDVGTIADFYLSDGSVIHTVKGDGKSLGDAGATEWGHAEGQCVLEFIGHSDMLDCSPLYHVYGIPADGTVTTVKAVLGGNVLEDDIARVTAVREEKASPAAGSAGVSSDSNAGSGSTTSGALTITSHHDWGWKGNRPVVEPSENDFPLDKYKETGSHDGTGGDASKVNIDKSHMNDAVGGHGELAELKYIVLHSTESNGASPEAICTAWANATGDREGVGAHFVVGYDGKIFQYVSTNLICWHAGSQGTAYDSPICSCSSHTEFPSEVISNGLNNYSIGIEICHDTGEDYTEAQLEAVDNLIAYLGGAKTVPSNRDNCNHGGNNTASRSGNGYNASTGNAIVDRAMAELGKDYEWGAVGPDTYDCSGLVSYAVSGDHMRIGNTNTFMGWAAAGEEVSASEAKPGDIVSSATHCGIYIGNGEMIHAPCTGDVVKIGPVQSGMVYIRHQM